jgi:hypothetical protein
MNALAIGLAGLAIAACSNPETISVVLLHCGMKPVTVEGRLWEAPPQTVDDDSMLPLDAGNRPDDWVGQGTVVVTDDRMTYTDQGGEVVEFVPDDGIPLGVCM